MIEVTFSKPCVSVTFLMNSSSRFYKYIATHAMQARYSTQGGSFETRFLNLCAALLRAALDMPQKVAFPKSIFSMLCEDLAVWGLSILLHGFCLIIKDMWPIALSLNN